MCRILGHTVHAVDVGWREGGDKGFGKDAVELGGVHGAHILARPLKRMQRRIRIPLHDENVALALAAARLGRPCDCLHPLPHRQQQHHQRQMYHRRPITAPRPIGACGVLTGPHRNAGRLCRCTTQGNEPGCSDWCRRSVRMIHAPPASALAVTIVAPGARQSRAAPKQSTTDRSLFSSALCRVTRD